MALTLLMLNMCLPFYGAFTGAYVTLLCVRQMTELPMGHADFYMWQALRQEGVSSSAIVSILSEVDRDNNHRIDYDEVRGKGVQASSRAAARNHHMYFTGCSTHTVL